MQPDKPGFRTGFPSRQHCRAPVEARLSDKIDERCCPTLLIAMLAAAIESRADDPSSLKLLDWLKTTEEAALWLLGVIANPRFRALLIDGNKWTWLFVQRRRKIEIRPIRGGAVQR
jgi:hypothetical protein